MSNGTLDFTAADDCAAILPAQYFDHTSRRKLLEGEYRLLAAVLEEAVRSYVVSMSRRTEQQRLDFEQLRCWFRASGSRNRQELFAFESICDLLGIGAEALRAHLSSIGILDLPTRLHLIRFPLVSLPRSRRRRASAHRLHSRGREVKISHHVPEHYIADE